MPIPDRQRIVQAIPVDRRTPYRFRFPVRDGEGAFSALVHKDNANGALERMEEAWDELNEKNRKRGNQAEAALRYMTQERDLYRQFIEGIGVCIDCLDTGNAGVYDATTPCPKCNGKGGQS